MRVLGLLLVLVGLLLVALVDFTALLSALGIVLIAGGSWQSRRWLKENSGRPE